MGLIKNQLVRGVVAGVAGTAVMTAWQEAAGKLVASDAESQSQDEKGDAWEQAPVPAKVARRFIGDAFHKDVPADQIPLLTNAMHWSYGTAWGVPYAAIVAAVGRSRLVHGVPYGVAVWAASYAQLVPLGFYEPPWKYPAKDVALDVSYHLAYGLGMASAFKLLGG